MKKRNLIDQIFVESDKEFLSYLEENFNVNKVSDEILKKNINTYESLEGFHKKLILSRLNGMEESHDMTAIFVGLVALSIGFIGAYGNFLKLIMPSEILAAITLVLSYVIAFLIFAISLGNEKGKRSKVKYLQNLFK